MQVAASAPPPPSVRRAAAPPRQEAAGGVDMPFLSAKYAAAIEASDGMLTSREPQPMLLSRDLRHSGASAQVACFAGAAPSTQRSGVAFSHPRVAW